MKKNAKFRRVLHLLPLFVIYVGIIALFSHDRLIGDENRHMHYVGNLQKGFYTDADNPEFRNGPGYPMVITPAVVLGVPRLAIKLLNACFLFLAVTLFYGILDPYLSPARATALSYLFGLYPPFLKWLVYLHSENLAIFLCCGFLYFFLKMNREEKNRYLNAALSAFFLGMLALTKIIFGYVILTVLIFYAVAYLFKKSIKTRSTLLVLGGGFLLCIPYLAYTYSLTDKFFLWGTGGGEILYWRSTPFPGEYGDWVNKDVILGDFRDTDYFDTERLIANHGDFVQSLEPYSIVERDSMYRAKAIDQMGEYPLKYLANTGASALRLFFNYPYSYNPQKLTSFFYILPNMFLVMFLMTSLYLAFRNFKALPFEIRFAGLFALVFIGGLIVLDGHVRHLLPILPALLFAIVFVQDRMVRVNLK